MNREYERRLSALEALNPASRGGAFHQIVWRVGQSWAEVVSAYNDGQDIRPGDHVLIYGLVTADPDLIRDRDRPISKAWLEAKCVVASLPAGDRPSRPRA